MKGKQKLAAVLIAALISASAAAQQAADARVAFHIEAQPIGKALTDLGEQAGLRVLVRAEDLKAGQRLEKPVDGELTIRAALERVLAESGLSYEFLDEKTVRVAAGKSTTEMRNDNQRVWVAQTEGTATSQDPRQPAGSTEEREAEKTLPVELEEIVVTGTHIRGIPADFSPLTTYSNESIVRMGVTSLDQFLSRVTANATTLSTNGGAVGAVGSERVSNDEAVNAIDLRGLGVGTTLVLLNGRRLALSNGARTPDVSLIPLSAIDRVEVLTDGASAIYGSDAVAGVVNFILRDDLQGAQTTVGFGGVTDGGQQERRIEQSFGGHWNSGHGLLGYSYLDRDALDASDRSFATVTSPYSLIPSDRRQNLMGTLDQKLSERVGIFADVLYSKRDTNSVSTRHLPFINPTANVLDTRKTGQDQYFANAGLRADWNPRLHGELLTSYSRLDTDQDWDSLDRDTQVLSPLSTTALASTLDATAKLDGEFFELQAGALKYSIGLGYSKDRYVSKLHSPFFDSRDDLHRRTRYSFAEVFIPLVGSAQRLRGIHRLELNAAARYTDYSDFGSRASPKVALLWAPVPGVSFRGTYGESFRAPFLSQMNPNSIGSTLLRPADFGIGPWAADVVVLFTSGSNPGLNPEEAKSYTFGFDFKPQTLSGLRVNGTYFNIDYSGRIAQGDATGGIDALFNPQLYPDLFIANPTADFVTPIVRGSNGGAGPVNGIGTTIDLSDPQAVASITDVVLDDRLRNLLNASVDGIDLSANYVLNRNAVDYNFGAEATRLLNSRQQISSNSPLISIVGTLLNPVDLRVRAYGGFSLGGLNAQLNINYWNDYTDPYAERDVASWTTVDLAASYAFSQGTSYLNGVRVSISVQNLFDKNPPFVATAPGTAGLGEPIGYDPTNANPVGRFIGAQLSKQW